MTTLPSQDYCYNRLMKKVAKLVVRSGNEYLMMYRSDHPTFGQDPDLPGGTVEDGESVLDAMLREVEEEIGWSVDKARTEEIFSGSDYSKNGTHYSLFITDHHVKPNIKISWEHSSYEWIGRSEFIAKALSAKDTYMHMVGKELDS